MITELDSWNERLENELFAESLNNEQQEIVDESVYDDIA
jgi:hypothetical protein